jgi:hypothetical protein
MNTILSRPDCDCLMPSQMATYEAVERAPHKAGCIEPRADG